jgi:hypothetical protein
MVQRNGASGKRAPVRTGGEFDRRDGKHKSKRRVLRGTAREYRKRQNPVTVVLDRPHESGRGSLGWPARQASIPRSGNRIRNFGIAGSFRDHPHFVREVWRRAMPLLEPAKLTRGESAQEVRSARTNAVRASLQTRSQNCDGTIKLQPHS